MPSLLQRQLFKELFQLFCLAACVLLTLILLSRAVQMRELFLGLDLGILDTIKLFGFMSPLFLMLVIPIACMLSVFLTFLRMGTDRELVALKAGGINLYQMLPAPFVFSVLCLGLTLWVSLHWLAWGMDHFRDLLVDIAGSRARIVVQPGVFNNEFPGLVLFARKVDPETGDMQQILMDDRSNPERNIIILAPSGQIQTESDKGALLFSLQNGRIYSTTENNTSMLMFDEYNVRLPLDRLFKNLDLGELRPRDMSWTTLRALAADSNLQTNPELANTVAVELHKRWAYPAACVALSLFILPLATAFQGMHRQLGLVLALVMFFVYYSLMSLGFTLGEAGALPPAISLWFPNMLFLSLGFYGLRLTVHERVPNLVRRFRLRPSTRPQIKNNTDNCQRDSKEQEQH